MTEQAFNFITTIGKVDRIDVYDNILHEHIISIDRKNFQPKYAKTYTNTMRFISDLEELGFRIKNLFKDFSHNLLSVNSYAKNAKALYQEIGSRFDHYFEADDMPMVAYVIDQIFETSRKDDFVYRYFNENSLSFIQKKTKQKYYFESINKNLKSFDESIANYV